MPRLLTSAAAAGILASCTTARLAMDANHPASASAPEAFTPAARRTLRPDANTLHTRELLAQREQQAKAAEAEPAVDAGSSPTAPSPDSSPMKDMKGMNHESH